MLTVSVLGAVEAHRDGVRAGPARGQDHRAAGAARARRRDAGAVRHPHRGPVGRARGPQHPAVEGLPAAPRARRPRPWSTGTPDGYRLAGRRRSRGRAPGGRPRGRVRAGPGRRRRRPGGRTGATRGWPCSAERCWSRPATGPPRTAPGWRRPASGWSRTAWRPASTSAPAARWSVELEALVEEHPLREGLWASLITALYRAGRQADALAAYGRVRRVLVDELGLEPGRGAARARAAGAAAEPVAAARERHADGGPRAGQPADGRSRVSRLVPGRPRRRPGHRARRPRRAPAGHARRPGRRRQDPARDRGRRGADRARRGLAGPPRRGRPGRRGRRPRPDRRRDARRRRRRRATGRPAVRGGHGPAARQLRARRRRGGPARDRAAVRRTHPARARHQPGAARGRRRAGAPARAADAGRLGGPVHPAGSGDAPAARARPGGDRGGRGGVPVARRPAAGDRAGRLAGAVAVGARHRPAARRPVRAPARPHQPAPRAPPGAVGGDRVELRPAVPRRPARAVGAVLLRGQRDAGRDRARAGRARRCRPRPCWTRSAGSSTARSSAVESGEGGAVRYRLLDSIKAYAAQRLSESGQGTLAAAAHASWYAATAAWCDQHVRTARQPECLAVARAERSNVDAGPGLVRRSTTRPSASGSPPGSAGPGSCSATAPRGRPASAARCPTTPLPATAPPGCCSRAGSRPRPATWRSRRQTSTGPRAAAGALDDEVLLADVERHQAFLAIQEGRPDLVLPAGAASLATYRRLGLPWPTAASLLLSAYGALMVGDTAAATRDATEALGVLGPARRLVGDGARAGDDRRDRAGRAPLRRRRRRAGAGRRGVRRDGLPRPGGAAPLDAGPGAAPPRRPGRPGDVRARHRGRRCRRRRPARRHRAPQRGPPAPRAGRRRWRGPAAGGERAVVRRGGWRRLRAAQPLRARSRSATTRRRCRPC